MIRIKRVYDAPAAGDGTRVLVDRLWPRGLRRARAAVGLWRRDLAPSNELRRWYGHEPSRYEGFRARYRVELLRQPDALAEFALQAERGPLTLLCAAREPERSNAAVLQELLEEVLNGGPASPELAPRRTRHAGRRPPRQNGSRGA